MIQMQCFSSIPAALHREFLAAVLSLWRHTPAHNSGAAAIASLADLVQIELNRRIELNLRSASMNRIEYLFVYVYE